MTFAINYQDHAKPTQIQRTATHAIGSPLPVRLIIACYTEFYRKAVPCSNHLYDLS